ncbi:MAG: hypothetical protein JXA01_03635 [Dehalococcoidia bacterium]|nr:hypothetical protein [Dehalococcoidia bacterium]
MEDQIISYISKLNADKVRLTGLIAFFAQDISGNEKQTLIYKKIFPALLNMEKGRKIKLSWDVMLSRYSFPRYIYPETGQAAGDGIEQAAIPLWQRQIENILKRHPVTTNKKTGVGKLQDKFEKFSKRYDKSSQEISPSDDWIKVITAVMEANLSQYDVMHACIEAFKAGAVWEKYKKEFEQ